MVLGSFLALIHGAALPAMIVVFGDMTDLFVFDAILKNFVEENWYLFTEYPYYNFTSQDEVISNPEVAL